MSLYAFDFNAVLFFVKSPVFLLPDHLRSNTQ